MTWAKRVRWLPVLVMVAIVLALAIAVVTKNWGVCSLVLVIGAVAVATLVEKE